MHNGFLQQVREAHIARVDAAMLTAQRRAEAGIAMPAGLQDVGIFLAAAGYDDTPCEGERWFGMDFDAYRALIGREEVEAGRRVIYGGRNPLIRRPVEMLDAA